jgi:hypothetical protein
LVQVTRPDGTTEDVLIGETMAASTATFGHVFSESFDVAPDLPHYEVNNSPNYEC